MSERDVASSSARWRWRFLAVLVVAVAPGTAGAEEPPGSPMEWISFRIESEDPALAGTLLRLSMPTQEWLQPIVGVRDVVVRSKAGKQEPIRTPDGTYRWDLAKAPDAQEIVAQVVLPARDPSVRGAVEALLGGNERRAASVEPLLVPWRLRFVLTIVPYADRGVPTQGALGEAEFRVPPEATSVEVHIPIDAAAKDRLGKPGNGLVPGLEIGYAFRGALDPMGALKASQLARKADLATAEFVVTNEAAPAAARTALQSAVRSYQAEAWRDAGFEPGAAFDTWTRPLLDAAIQEVSVSELEATPRGIALLMDPRFTWCGSMKSLRVLAASPGTLRQGLTTALERFGPTGGAGLDPTNTWLLRRVAPTNLVDIRFWETMDPKDRPPFLERCVASLRRFADAVAKPRTKPLALHLDPGGELPAGAPAAPGPVIGTVWFSTVVFGAAHDGRPVWKKQ